MKIMNSVESGRLAHSEPLGTESRNSGFFLIPGESFKPVGKQWGYVIMVNSSMGGQPEFASEEQK